MNDDVKFSNRCERIRRLIHSRPGITGTELADATGTLGEFERKDAIDWLIAQGAIRKEVTPSRGRPKTTYWPATPAASPVTSTEAQPAVPRIDGDPDSAQMTPDEIRAFNERRRNLNANKPRGFLDLPLLPMPL
jgi:hypothetical protein